MIVVINSLDSVVGHKVAVIEEETVETDTVGKLEVLSCTPLVLSVDTEFVELYSCSRILLSAVTVGKADNLRSRTVDEVIYAEVTVVTCSVSHVSIVSHLIFIAQTCCKLMGSEVVCKVILHICNCVVNCVVPCEELVSERDVRGVCTCTVHDVNEWELA